MIPNPIRKVLLTFCENRVQYLLMGGQACVLYGGAEFSRDTDFAVCGDTRNLGKIQHVLDELDAHVIAVPPFELEYLERGHAVHFRCAHPDVTGMPIDIMSRMRGVAPFETLWERRSTVELSDGLSIEVMSLPDLVTAKKTQRDKDWLMLRRLLEADYVSCDDPDEGRIRFWLTEMRTVSLLADVVRRFPAEAEGVAGIRPAVRAAVNGESHVLVDRMLIEEESTERSLDVEYWEPLRRELENCVMGSGNDLAGRPQRFS